MENPIYQCVRHQHATPNTIFHAMYAHFHLGIPKKDLSQLYCKAESTIHEWFRKYRENGSVKRKQRMEVFRKFNTEKRVWLLELYQENPMLFLDEARLKFKIWHPWMQFQQNISIRSICTILHEYGLSWKTVERRSMEIRESEIVRFVRELLSIPWDTYNLVFLDEVSFDNRDMLRRKGYGAIGKKLIVCGEFSRKPRLSFLCFLGVNGILDSFWTEGTFNRIKFFESCKKFALKNPQVQKYPGFHSVWIMDGAKIHCQPQIIQYLRSIGIVPIFLPPYCPFFNPIEIIFGLIKKHLQRHRQEGSKNFLIDVCDAINQFRIYPCKNIFEHCGYFGGNFLPEKCLAEEQARATFSKISK
ncbi:uncharacterized protein LOC129741539 [Uranotaenia lowii]|uniref:uncharacterized protein LOC129741539 n=1 Tax=Uranotaenia lowii TaxID=190385 RepID=UPI0024785971|nr:uncharacterized protein LOC129741539 [Uranotaenia lowii]